MQIFTFTFSQFQIQFLDSEESYKSYILLFSLVVDN